MSEVSEMNDQDLTSVIKTTSKLVLVDFFTPTCRPCKAMLPIVKQISKSFESELSAYKINILENNVVSSQYKVTGVPTFLIFHGGKEIGRKNGFMTVSQFKEWVELLLQA